MRILFAMKHRVLFFALFALLIGKATADDFDATSAPVGHTDAGLVTPANQLVTPAGTLIPLPGMRPQALALSPDGKLLATAGHTHELVILDPATGKISQRVRLPSDKMPAESALSAPILEPDNKAQLSYTGLAFSPDGSRIYMANVQGDIKVFRVDKNSTVSPLFSIPLPPANAPRRANEIPAGIAISRDGKKLYVALNLSNRLAELDAETGKVLRLWDVGVAPFDVALVRNKVYVSNWGGRRPDALSFTGPAGQGTTVRVDNRYIASEGSVSVIDLNSKLPAQSSELITGPHACAMAVSPNSRYLVVANAGSDTLSVMDTRSDKIIETICARQDPGDLFGAQPNALAFDKRGKTLFVCNGTQNAVAVFHFVPGESRLLGLIPVGWFPGAVIHDARRRTLCVANIKDIASSMEKAKAPVNKGMGFNTHQYAGSLSLVPVPSASELPALTRKALANLRYPLLAQAKLPPRTNATAVPVPERVGEPSVFKHVIYIIKENRTYDQVLGDITNANGNADLCVFGERVTPNQHKLVREFTLLDNTYCSSILSADGHNWADSSIANDYIERSFADWPRSYPSGGGTDCADALAWSSAGFIWDDALAHGKTFRDYGEYTTGHNRWTDHKRKKDFTFLDAYRNLTNGSDEITFHCEPDVESLRPYMRTDFPSWDLDVPDQVRAAKFIEDLKQYEREGEFPQFTILWLPNDHTSGTKEGSPKPEAQVADNDLAVGKVIEAISHSSFWKDTCIFGIEDDPQNGWDHVSGYRTTAYVVSPYTKRNAVVSTQYNQTSLLRTMELILGLPPMNQMDATATPMFDCFTSTPDFAPFDAVTNNVPLDAMNPSPKKISDSLLRKDAYASARLPLELADKCPEGVLNEILWRAVKGTQAPYPAWAVKVVDDD